MFQYSRGVIRCDGAGTQTTGLLGTCPRVVSHNAASSVLPNPSGESMTVNPAERSINPRRRGRIAVAPRPASRLCSVPPFLEDFALLEIAAIDSKWTS